MSIITKSKSRSIAKPAGKKIIDASAIPDIIGGPPETGSHIDVTENLRLNSSLIMDITPCVTAAESGISLFRLVDAWGKYKELLSIVGFSPSPDHNINKSIRIAAQAESFPSDTFSNDYGEHFLNSITDIAGQGFGQMAQMMGTKTTPEALKRMGNLSSQIGKTGGVSGAIFDMVGSGLQAGGGKLQEIVKAMSKQGGMAGSVATSMSELLAGARIDFPMIWKNSTYNPSFTCNIRLYNPNPGNKDDTKKYIIAPLAAILTISLPQSTSSGAYSWPFFCKVNCPGLFKIPAGAITNVTITKGGDAGLVAFNQIPSIVDVKIDFVNLYGTILLSKSNIESRPTLKGYLDNMLDSTEPANIYKEDDYSKNQAELDINPITSYATGSFQTNKEPPKPNPALSKTVSTNIEDPAPTRTDAQNRLMEKRLNSLPGL